MKTDGKARSLSDLIDEEALSMSLKLPVFPGAALELQQLLAADDSSTDQIAEVISKDQALASHVLKLANSALYSGMNRNIRTISDAIMRLGSNHIFNLVICSAQQSYHKSSNKMMAKYLDILWQHALSVAAGSKWLIQQLGYRALGDDAFLSGLLHDIGKLLIIKIIESIRFNDRNIDLSDALFTQVVELMHAEHGHRLLDSWGVPPAYCNVCLNHHNKLLDTSDVLLISVRISNHVARKVGISTSTQKSIDLTALPEAKVLNIDVDILTDLETFMIDATQAEYNRLNELRS